MKALVYGENIFWIFEVVLFSTPKVCFTKGFEPGLPIVLESVFFGDVSLFYIKKIQLFFISEYSSGSG